YDRSTNLFHNYHRDYDPQTGRYVQSDPIGIDGGINTYLYANGSPTDYFDMYGLDATQTFNWGPGYQPRVHSDPASLLGKSTKKNEKDQAQCVELIKQTVGDGQLTSTWRQGKLLDANTPVGTAVGTFNREGKFDTNDTGQHAGILMTAKDKNGRIVLVDQWAGKETITSRTVGKGHGRYNTPSNNAGAYNVILIPVRKKK
ncbi:BPSL0067 family protein, partial [Massilia scottii]|uniref:BPSL0067 family protein n=1 Tax=Massilia scottii TaxID=3057166 RepID=UPI00279686E9